MVGETDDRDVSRADIAIAVQQAFELCATCAHTRADHDGDCQSTQKSDSGNVIHCDCTEFWERRELREDGLPVIGHEFGLTGTLSLNLDRRLTTELWERMKSAGRIAVRLAMEGGWEVQVEMVVGAKGYKVLFDDGIPLGVVEQRKLKADRLEVVKLPEWWEA